MPDSDIPKDPTGPAGGPRCWDTGEKAPGNERPQRLTAAPGLAGGVGVYWGERSPSWLLSSFPFLWDPSHCFSCCAPPRPAKVPPSPAPAPCVAVSPPSPGAEGVSGSCLRLLPLGSFKAAGQREVSLLRSARSLQKSPASPSVPLLLPVPVAPGAGDCGAPATPLRGDPDSLLRAPGSSRDSQPAVAAARAAFLSRLPGPPRAQGELGQQPRDAGAAGLRAPAPQLAGPAAPGGRGGGGERRALLETRC